MTIKWNAYTRIHITIESDLGISLKELLGDELYRLIYDLNLSLLSPIIEAMRKNREEASGSSDHVRNEGKESPANTENPTSEQMQEIDGKHEEDEEVRSVNEEQELNGNFKNLEINQNGDDEEKTEEKKVTENVEDQETTMTSEWNLERLESAISRLNLFWDQVFGEVNESELREIRSAYERRLEELTNKKEELSGSSSHGGNEEQESTENGEKCAGNENGDQDLGENDENQEEERRAENVENPEENPVIMEEAGFAFDNMDEWPTLDDASLVAYRRRR